MGLSTEIKVESTEVQVQSIKDSKSKEFKVKSAETESNIISNNIESTESKEKVTDVVRKIEVKSLGAMKSMVESDITENVNKPVKIRRQSTEITEANVEDQVLKKVDMKCSSSINAHSKIQEIDTKEETQSLKYNSSTTVCPPQSTKDIVPTKKYITKEEKEDLTKELLKNIVSSLEPNEAKKLLEKASLKELKLLLVTSDQESSQVEEDLSNKQLSN